MSRPAPKKPSTKRQLTDANAENRELRRLLARLVPSSDHRSRDRVWRLLGQYADHFTYLNEMSTPLTARKLDRSPSRDADKPVMAGVRLSEREGSREVYHGGRPFEREADRLYRRMQTMLDQSAAWVRGIDLDPERVPSARRPRCECGELVAIAFKWCPWCGTELVTG